MVVKELWMSIIVSTGTILNKRAQFLILQIGPQKTGIINLYATNSPSKRASFWISLSEYAGLAGSWLVGGDFNMIEEASDRRGGTISTITGREAQAWDSFCFSFGLLDLWNIHSFSPMQGSLHFSRSDGSVFAANLARLDRFYASSFFQDGLGSMGIIASTITSNHYPLKLNIVFTRRSYLTKFRIPTSLLADGNHRVSIPQILSKFSFFDASLFGDITHAILDVKSFFINIVASSVDRCNAKMVNLRRALAATQKLLEKFPTSPMLLSNLQQVKSNLKEKQHVRVIQLPGHKSRLGLTESFSVSSNRSINHYLLKP